MADTKSPLYIITGATDVTGRIIAQRLAAQGHALLLACYDTEKSEQFARQLTVQTLNRDIQCLHLDLGSFSQVKQFVEQVKALNRPIGVLVNNASYISRHSEKSPDGYEKLVQVNFLSTVLLTLLINPLMREGGRIIFTTSLSRHLVTLPYEFPAVSNFMPIAAYAQSKLALSLFSIYLSTVLRTRHVAVNIVDPGIIDVSMARVSRLINKVDMLINRDSRSEMGVNAMMRAIESSDTGFIFKGGQKQIKASTLIRNREAFVKLCNDTMRIMKKYI